MRRLYSPHARSRRRRPSLQGPSFISDVRPVCMLFAPWYRRRRWHTTDRILATKLRNVFMKFNERRRIVSSDCKPRHRRSSSSRSVEWLSVSAADAFDIFSARCYSCCCCCCCWLMWMQIGSDFLGWTVQQLLMRRVMWSLVKRRPFNDVLEVRNPALCLLLLLIRNFYHANV